MLKQDHELKGYPYFILENLLILFFGYDFVVKLIVYFYDFRPIYYYIVVYKFLLVALLIVYYKKISYRRDYLLPIFGLFLSYFITKILPVAKLSNYDILFNGYYFLSSIIPLLFVYLNENLNNDILNKILRKASIFILISSILAIIGAVFQIPFFKTYFISSNRYGYSGFLLYHHEIGYIYFILMNYLFFKYKNKENFLNLFLLFFIIIIALLAGTKKSMLLAVIFLFYFTVINFYKLKKILVAFTLFLTGVFLLNNVIIEYILFFSQIRERVGVLGMLLSYRNSLLTENLMPYIENNKSLINVMFGWEVFKQYRSEMELFDLFLFFGFIGIISYILFFKRLLRNTNRQSYFMVFSLLFTASLSGNMMISVNVMIFMCMVLFYMRTKNNSKI